MAKFIVSTRPSILFQWQSKVIAMNVFSVVVKSHCHECFFSGSQKSLPRMFFQCSQKSLPRMVFFSGSQVIATYKCMCSSAIFFVNIVELIIVLNWHEIFDTGRLVTNSPSNLRGKPVDKSPKNVVIYTYINLRSRCYIVRDSSAVRRLFVRLAVSEPTSLCSFSLVLCALRKSNKYQFYSLVWTDRGSNTRSTAFEESTLTDAVSSCRTFKMADNA